MTVNTFETRRPNASPKVTTILRFATRTPPIPVTVDTFETRRPNASPKVRTILRFATDFDSQGCATLSEHKRSDFWSPPGPLTPTLKREPFCGAFGKRSPPSYAYRFISVGTPGLGPQTVKKGGGIALSHKAQSPLWQPCVLSVYHPYSTLARSTLGITSYPCKNDKSKQVRVP